MLSAKIGLTIYLLECPHRSGISTENSVWCSECKAWIDGEDIGDIYAEWEGDGEIVVWGGGWAPHGE